MDDETRYDKKIYSEIISSDAYEVLREVKTILDRLEMALGIDTDQCFDIKVILSELLQNAIKHGNQCDISKKIRVDVWLNDNKTLGITVKDQGCGFDSNKAVNTAKTCISPYDPMNLDESGRGLFIVQNLCDFIEFNSAGNTVTVRKKL